MTNYILDPAAALAEGIAPMPADLISLRDESVVLAAEIDRLTSLRDGIKAEFGKRLTDEGLTGFILDGKVRARRTSGTRTGVDAKKFREELPSMYAKYLKITSYVSIKID